MSWSTLLTPDDVMLLLVDPEPALAFATDSSGHALLENNLVALGKTASAFELPVVLTTSGISATRRHVLPPLVAALRGLLAIERAGMNAWDDPAVVSAVHATGRRTILLAGLLTEASVAFTALSALASDFDVRVVVDACGASCAVAQKTSVLLMMQAGMIPRTWLQVLLELQRDWTRGAHAADAAAVVKEHGGAYGLGVE